MLKTSKILCILLKVLILTTVITNDTSLKDLENGILPLEWKPPQVHTSQVISYRLEGYIVKNDYKQSNQTDEQWHLYYEGKDNYWLIDEKNMNQKCYFRVQAKNVYGSGEWSNSSIVDLTEFIETPTMPYNLPVLILIVISFVVAIINVYYFYCSCRQRNKSNRKDITPPIMTDNEQEPNPFDIPIRLVNSLNGTKYQGNQFYLEMEDIPDVSKRQDKLNDIELEGIRLCIPIIKKEQIIRTKILGVGAFGEVFQGTVKNLEGSSITPVAIKMLEENVSLEQKKEFLQEAKIMSQFHDEHVLRVLGICIDMDSPWLVLELMEGGDLLQYLRESQTLQASDARALRLQDLLAMCEDVARGCCHFEKLGFVHGDLACRNCLISTRNRKNRIVKIGDFGLTRDIYNNDYYRMKNGGKVRWMAPESLKDKIFTLKTDVWAFGVLMWEIMSLGEQPYSDKSNSEVTRYVREGGKLSKPLNCPLALCELMQRCWDAEHKRPTFQSCLENIVTLKEDLNNIELYNPEFFKWQEELNDIELYMTIIKEEQIAITKLLGEGAFGKVFQGTVPNLKGSPNSITPVAIKMLRRNVSLKEKKELLQEAKIMSQFHDEHVLRLLGICIGRDPPCLVFELMEGDLLQYLKQSRALQSSDAHALRLQDLFAMCEDVARGCCHFEKLRYVHRDLACRNCLISTRNRKNRIVKIGDFGLARDIYQNDYYRMKEVGALPIRWMAPESLKNEIYTLKSDVWAFGVLMWEIMSLGERPYFDKSNSEVIEYVLQGDRLSEPLNCPLTLYQLMQRCWTEANKRLTFKSCLENIVTLRDNIEDAILIASS